MVRSAVRACAATVPVACIAAGLWHGWPAAASAAAGTIVVTAFFALGVIGVNVVICALPGMAVVAGLFVYVTQLMILLLVLALARDVGLLDRAAFAWAAVAGTMVWQVAHTRAYVRARTPLYAPKEES